MSRGLEDLLSYLVREKSACEDRANSNPTIDSAYRWNVRQAAELGEQIERVLRLLERR